MSLQNLLFSWPAFCMCVYMPMFCLVSVSILVRGTPCLNLVAGLLFGRRELVFLGVGVHFFSCERKMEDSMTCFHSITFSWRPQLVLLTLN